MALKNNNPTKTASWKKLTAHFQDIQETTLKELFKRNPNRSSDFRASLNDLKIDYSKNRITEETMRLLVDLAEEIDLKDAIAKYFSGDLINQTEKRAVLHTALRDFSQNPILVEGVDVKPQITSSLEQIEKMSNAVISGAWRGFSGKKITDIVNIGIGGSDLGSQMAVEALQYYKNQLHLHFVSNIDGDHVSEILRKINPETTLFVLVSKTFSTQETITNANTVKEWFLNSATPEAIAKHFIAVSTNIEAIDAFGIDKKNVFPMWNWVGGRFSLWSAVGLSISLAVGFENFKQMLEGASEMDTHFKNTPFPENIPVILALLGIWYNNFFGCRTEAVLPYAQYLEKLTPYLQQATMESNGKGVDRNGDPVDYPTGTIVWGSTGTNMQHAFMQLIHQGTQLIPTDFIGFEESLYGRSDHHKKLLANYYAQMDALAFGKTKEEVCIDLGGMSPLVPFKVFPGNRPSTAITLQKMSPRALGKLIAMYEHKLFVQGVIWNIYSFDQFGVELGKELANKYLKKEEVLLSS